MIDSELKQAMAGLLGGEPTSGVDVNRALDAGRSARRARRIKVVVSLAVAVLVVGVGVPLAATALVRKTDRGPAVHPSPHPTHSLGLTAPLIAPKSLLDVRMLGFRVEPVPGFNPEGLGAGWSLENDGQTVTLRWDEVADKVDVTVLYQGQPRPLALAAWGHVEDVTIHGASGQYVEQPGGPYSSIDGDFKASVTWEYAPHSWALVSAHSDRGDPGPQRLRAALIEVAEAVAAGGDPVRLPLRMNALPASMPTLSALSGVGVHKGSSGWEARLEFGSLEITAGPGAVPQACEMYGGGIETFTYQGNAGCLTGEGATDQPPPGTAFNFVEAIALQVGETVRAAVPRDTGDWFSYHIKEWKQLLAGLTVTQLDDEATWVDVKTAMGT